VDKAKYIASIEHVDGTVKTIKEISLFCDPSTTPNVGDFIQAFKEQGMDMELKDYINMVFIPVNRASNDHVSIRIIRTFKDLTYHVNKRK
jgi:hypothetical protein